MSGGDLFKGLYVGLIGEGLPPACDPYDLGVCSLCPVKTHAPYGVGQQ